jgi:hypothetical protein
MPLVIRVPLNTRIAALDESLRTLLRRELGRHGFDGVEVAFDAPTKEWAASVAGPTVNLFLHDLRESLEHRPVEWNPRRDANGSVEDRPPLRLDVSYAVTAWTRAVEDEHRLLSQVLAVLYAYPALPDETLSGTLVNGGAPRFPLHGRVAQARSEGKADFWSAVGGQYKAALDYVVTLSCEAGTTLERPPEVRTQTVRLRNADNPAGVVAESHRIGGVVRDDDGEPVADAWVALVDHGALAVTDREGRFRFDRMTAGTYRCRVRTADGAEGEAQFALPGGRADITVRRKRARR